MDYLLWSDIKTMFELHVEDEIWKIQQGYKVLEWKLYDSCGVHSLMKQSMQIYMLVEKKYPLRPPTLSMMLKKKRQIDYESEMAYQLNSSKNKPRLSSNDMVYNHYLEEAKNKTHDKGRNSKPSVMPSATSQSTTNYCKPKPKIDNIKSRNWPASKSSCVTTKIVPIAEHSRNSRNFSDFKHFICSTCQKCVFNENHVDPTSIDRIP
nr:hypothetical protein [Tanacetum cinerariifolium]